MKKKIISVLILGMYFFGGIGIVFATPPITQAQPQDDVTGVDKAVYDNAISDGKTPSEASTIAGWYKPPESSSPSWGPDDMTSTSFHLDPGYLSPSQKTYNQGTSGNFKDILARIGKYLLIATTTIAVLSIVVGGLMISTTGPSDRAAKGKTIIMLNIMAIIVALFSYSIIKLVSWLIQ